MKKGERWRQRWKEGQRRKKDREGGQTEMEKGQRDRRNVKRKVTGELASNCSVFA